MSINRVGLSFLISKDVLFWRRQHSEDEWDETAEKEWSDDEWEDADNNQTRSSAGCRWLAVLGLVLITFCVTFLLIRRSGERTLPVPAAQVPNSQPPINLLSPTSVAVTELPSASPALPEFNSTVDLDVEARSGVLLDLINQARADAGLIPVEWDETAARVAQAHADDMIARRYFSHWNPEGLGPDHRYSLAGGEHSVRENLHALIYTYTDGRPAPIEDWDVIINNAHAGLMNSPGHRATILDPSRTHVGIGMTYDSSTGEFRLAEEFVGHHVTLNNSLPSQAGRGEVLHVEGVFGPTAVGNAFLDLAYEPFPIPLSLDELARRGTYSSIAESIYTQAIDLTFNESLALPNDSRSGYYHVRLFVDLPTGQALVVDKVIVVNGN